MNVYTHVRVPRDGIERVQKRGGEGVKGGRGPGARLDQRLRFSGVFWGLGFGVWGLGFGVQAT